MTDLINIPSAALEVAESRAAELAEACLSGPVQDNGYRTAYTSFRGVLIFAQSKGDSGVVRYRVTPTGNTIGHKALVSYLMHAESEGRKQDEINAKWVPMVAEVNYIDNQRGMEPTVTLKGKRDLSLKGTYRRFGVGAIPRGQSGRKEHGGAMVEGPWAFAFGLASVLSASKAMRERDAAQRAQDIVVEDGSELLIDGVWYTVRVERREFIKLIPVSR